MDPGNKTKNDNTNSRFTFFACKEIRNNKVWEDVVMKNLEWSVD